MFRVVKKTAKVGDREIVFETGRMARQASGAVLVTCGESMVLVTVVCAAHRDEASFFPLVVDYVEKAYAGGIIPGGYLKREGKLSDDEVLKCRLIDRPLRPMFPDGFKGETQIVATVLSHDGENDTDVLAITGASAALMLSPSPFAAPIAGVRVARVKGRLVANPTLAELAEADIKVVMACSREAIVMVEGEAKEATEAEMLDVLDFGFAACQPMLDAQLELQSEAGKEKIVFTPRAHDPEMMAKIEAIARPGLSAALGIRVKQERYAAAGAVKKKVMELVAAEYPDSLRFVEGIIDDIKSDIARRWATREKRRIDGRGVRQVRPIATEVRVLPRVHGSALFTRGETQGLVTATLGTDRDARHVDGITGKSKEEFMLHYNFPPFSVGEIKMMRGPGRREVGHGHLAKRSLQAVLPTFEKFPYVIRIVSEILESNGSSSMATVCGGSMALMDAGVPITAPVAGIAMGLIMVGDEYVILTDILGDEDHLGDMDFKVAGTERGITGLQMDIKISGLSRQIMSEAMDQAREGRLHILAEMARTIGEPNSDLSDYAPRITTLHVSADRIRDIIGAGGRTIRSITERTGTSISVEDDGTVKIASANRKATREAIDIIRALTAEPVVGEIYLGTVTKVAEFGAFVQILPGVEGLCHISELAEKRVDRTEDVVREGEEIVVKCLGVERGGKIRLSRKEALGKQPTVSAGKLAI